MLILMRYFINFQAVALLKIAQNKSVATKKSHKSR